MINKIIKLLHFLWISFFIREQKNINPQHPTLTFKNDCSKNTSSKIHQILKRAEGFLHCLQSLIECIWIVCCNELNLCWPHSPCGAVGQLSEGAWVSDQLVQDCDNLAKLWPFATPLLPAVQHELVQHHGTVHRGGKTVPLIYCFDYLRANENSGVLLTGGHHLFANQHMRFDDDDGGGMWLTSWLDISQ